MLFASLTDGFPMDIFPFFRPRFERYSNGGEKFFSKKRCIFQNFYSKSFPHRCKSDAFFKTFASLFQKFISNLHFEPFSVEKTVENM